MQSEFVAYGKLQPIVSMLFQYFVTARVLSKILNWRYHQERWPSEILPLSNLTTAIIRRVNEASGLYQMFAYLGDIILLSKLVYRFKKNNLFTYSILGFPFQKTCKEHFLLSSAFMALQ